MAMPRTNSQHQQGMKSLGFFLQCNGDSESTYVYYFSCGLLLKGFVFRTWSCNATADLRLVAQKEGVENMSRHLLQQRK